MKKFLSLTLCLLMLVPVFASCSKPPEYSEIEARFRELVEASGEINMIFFGEGLPTYERITDPHSTLDSIIEETTNEDGTVTKIIHWYYMIPDDTYGTVYAYKKGSIGGNYIYLCVLSAPDTSKTTFYEDVEKSIYAYVIEGYEEAIPERYYNDNDPYDYDYVRNDAEYSSVSDIKAAAEKVYSSEYLSDIYETMFIGSLSASDKVTGLSARYIEYADDTGSMSLMKSNTYDPFITEIRQYDFSTAKIVRPANGEYVTIEIVSYLPSKPAERLTVRLSMLLENGQWMLDSATY